MRDKYQLMMIETRPTFCVVTEGELRSLAMQWNWGAKKQDQMEFCLGYFRPVSIAHPSIFREYAAIDSYCESIGQPMGKNDLWIAATAAATGATLVTTDRDFDHLSPLFVTRLWIDPGFGSMPP